MGFIKAEPGIKHPVIYTDDTGNYFRYSGGTWAWRNNNPGNCRPGKISKSHGQIGVVFNFAVFPDKESGHLALLDVLKITYANSSIYEMMMVFAPPKENNTAKYIKFLRGIEQIEGYKEGEIVPIHKITHVRQDKSGCICDYYIDSTGWIVKESCIALARLNKVELEVCTSRLGHTYLKSASHSSFQPNLKKLVQKKPRK